MGDSAPVRPASHLRASVIALAVLATASLSRFAFRGLPRPLVDPAWKAGWVVLVVAGLWAAHRARLAEVPGELGLPRAPWRGLGVALLASLPMLAVLAVTAGRLPHPELGYPLVRSAVVAPIAEEVLFRGYAFRQLARRGGWGFWPAVIATALVFGLGHLGNVRSGAGLETALEEVAITALGGAFFAWLLARWDDLWVPIGLHAFMNLWWDVYAVDELAIGDTAANVARVLTIAAAIALTLRRTRRAA